MDDEPEKIEPMQLGPAIVQRIAAGRARVWLVSPYVTNDTAVAVFRDSDAPSRRLLTRYNISDIVAGATDLRAIAALVAAGVDVRVLEDVHAKVYVIDEWAYVGSANLTTRGLEASLRELGIASADVNHVRKACAYFERVWNEAHAVSQDDMDSSLEQLEHMRSEVEAVRRVRNEAEKRLARTAFAPRTPVERTRSAHSDLLEEALIELGGSVTAAQAIARVFAHAIRSVPNFATSEHWTLNEPNHLLRLNVGMVEVLTMSSWGLGVVALPETLSETEREEIKRVGGEVELTPYKTVQRIAPGGLRVVLPLAQVARFERLLCANLEAYIARDTSTARSLHRRAFSVAAMRTIARMADDAGLAKVVAKLEAAVANE